MNHKKMVEDDDEWFPHFCRVVVETAGKASAASKENVRRP